MTTQTFLGTLTVHACVKCGMHFGIPADYDARRREDHALFYCPSGHQQCYVGKTEAEKLRDEVAREKHWREQAEARSADFRQQRDAHERSARAFKGVATRIKKRVKHGVCPCCNRTFANVAAHMETKHPTYGEKPVSHISE